MGYKKPATSSFIGWFPSLKMGCSILYRSLIERDILYYFEYYREVETYVREPFTFTGRLTDGSQHKYTPDYGVQVLSDYGIIECEPAAKVQTRHAQQQCELGLQWANQTGGFFLQVTDQQLRSGHRLRGLKLLWKYARLPVADDIKIRCVRFIRRLSGTIEVAMLARYLSGSESLEYVPYVYHLVFHHVLDVDLNLPLTIKSLVWLHVE